MRTRILAVASTIVAGIGIGAIAAVTAGSANAAPENPALTGKRVLCVTSTGDFKALDAPCAGHKDAAGKPMWFAGPLPVPGAAGYAESIQSIAGTGSTGGLTEAEVKSLVDARVAAAMQTVTSGLPSKSVTVKFDADWNSNDAIGKTHPATTSATGAINLTPNPAGYLPVPASASTADLAKGGPESATGGRYYFTVTQTGLSAYSANQRELWWSNVSATTMASESDIRVDGLVQPSIGATTRTWVVSMATGSGDNPAAGTISAYGNSRSFTFTGSVLVP
jgi:hypothetical protein